MRSRVGLLVLVIALVGGGELWADEIPVAVSPGRAIMGAVVESRCPSFSWGMVQGARSYELVVYEVDSESEDTEPVLRQSFPGSVHGWTPALDECLEHGRHYAWSVRAVKRKEASGWSLPSLFEVASDPKEPEFEEALAVVRQYLEEAGSGTAPGSEESPASPPVESLPMAVSPPAKRSIVVPEPRASAAGDSDLQVNGAAVVTTATLGPGVGAQLCLAVDYRYVDLGDGTVLDCNMGLIWLKDASCADLAGTDASGQTTWATALSAAADLADGLCGLTDGSSAGDWRQPTITELCSAWSGSQLLPCPASAGSDSLMDTSVGPPTVVNAKGDAVWLEADAFVGVQGFFYWSATEFDTLHAWVVSLGTGNVSIFNKASSAYVWPVRN